METMPQLPASAEQGSNIGGVNVCDTCREMLKNHEGYEWSGTHDLTFRYQKSWQDLETYQDLEKSQPDPCCVCQVIFERINSDKTLLDVVKSKTPANASDDNTEGKRPLKSLLRAGLSSIRTSDSPGESEKLYRLTFRLEEHSQVGRFVLKPSLSGSEQHKPSPPISSTTGSDEVLKLAKKWIDGCIANHQECKVNPSPESSEYPTRLIDLSMFPKGRVRVVMRRRRKVLDNHYWVSKARALLSFLLREDGSQLKVSGPYMTLSHRWDNTHPIKLKPGNVREFLWKGISLKNSELPPTFLHAMEFASRLGIKYIWIDSLCIIQDPCVDEDPHVDEEVKKLHEKQREIHVKDWKEESKHMHEIYGGSYCNISATVSDKDEKGLFQSRSAKRWWTGLAPVKVKGIPGHTYGEPEHICQIEDETFWDRSVGNAPINQRGWVLQERLMAPRVLHFCEDQVAWECRHHDAAECLPEGIESVRFGSASTVHTRRLKGLDPKTDGIRLHRERVKDSKESGADIGALEIWRRIVEVYSKTKLTIETDKLIALSGFAKTLHGHIGGEYHAGLWSKNLASQLLWYVDPGFQWATNPEDPLGEQEGIFRHRAERPNQNNYLAPSWSWASVKTPDGIFYGAITSRECEIKIEKCETTVQMGSDEFGVLQKASIRVTGVLKQVFLIVEQNKDASSLRFKWRQYRKGQPAGDIYRNVYLDSPRSDIDMEFEGHPHAVRCVPVGMDESDHYCCLLLRHKQDNEYRRIGLIRIPNFDSSGMENLKLVEGKTETFTIV